MITEVEKLSLHFKYCSIMAIATIILIANDRWSGSKEFTTYLSNAATMTSLFLGVVAIFYSFISNDSMSRSLGSISTITNEVRDVRNEISEFVDLTKKASEISSVSTELVRDASVTLTTSMASLHETLVSLANQNETLRGLVSNLPTQIDQLDIKVADVAKAIGEKPQQNQTVIIPADLPRKTIEHFLSSSSLTYNLLTQACVVAADKEKILCIIDVAKAIDYPSSNNLQGFMACMHSMKLLSRDILKGKPGYYKITDIHPVIKEISRIKYLQYVESFYVTDSDERKNWLDRLEKVEALFE